VPEGGLYQVDGRAVVQRVRSVGGAARAAELSGDRKRANERYAELLQLCGRADAQRPELQQARASFEKR